jgi:hypothetical protein
MVSRQGGLVGEKLAKSRKNTYLTWEVWDGERTIFL